MVNLVTVTYQSLPHTLHTLMENTLSGGGRVTLPKKFSVKCVVIGVRDDAILAN